MIFSPYCLPRPNERSASVDVPLLLVGSVKKSLKYAGQAIRQIDANNHEIEESDMALLEQWQKVAYNEKADRGELQRFWQRYFLLEKGVYEKLLTNPDEKVEGTVKELADKYGLSIMDMTGFLDGINESLVEPNPIDTMEEDTKVSLVFDKEKLYKNMVDAKADWLYELPMWNDIFDPETKKRLYLEQKKSGTVIVGKKVGRNDPCPCGSGKKYKFCCGK